MDLVLYPRAAPQDRLRVWLGVFAATAAPALDWRLNGQSVVPTSLRQVASVRPRCYASPWGGICGGAEGLYRRV
jgi:hypothetical protein